MALTKQDLKQIDHMLRNAFSEFFSNTLLPVLTQFVTKQEFNALKEDVEFIKKDIGFMKEDIAFLKDRYVGTRSDIDLEITRAKSTESYLLEEINAVRTRMQMPPLNYFSSGAGA